MAQPGAVVYEAEFKADTEEGKKSLKSYAAEIEAVADATKQAERDAKESYKQHSLAARAAGASVERLAEIQQDYAQSLNSIKNAKKQLTDEIVKGNYAALKSEEALQVLRKETQAQIEANLAVTKELAAANAGAGHVVSGQSAASGAVQLLDGRGGIRTIENFLGNTLGLGGFFSLMFPVVGAIQSAKLVGDLGEKVYEVGHKAEDASKNITAAFDELNQKSRVSIDELVVEEDKLRDSTAKILGHPGDGLKTALDEARVYADKLQQALAADRKEIEAIFKANEVGFFGSALTGVEGTGTQQKQLLGDHKGFSADIAAANNNPSQIRAAYQKQITSLQTEARRLREEQANSEAETAANLAAGGEASTAVNNSAKISNIEGVLRYYQNGLAKYNQEQNVTSAREQNSAAKAQKQDAASAKIVQEANDKAQKNYWDDMHTQWEAASDRSADDEAQFWIKVASSLRTGSEGYNEALKRAAAAIGQTRKETARFGRENDKDGAEMDADFSKRFSSENEKGLDAGGKNSRAYIESLAKLGQAQDAAKYSIAESSIQFDLAAGRISHYDAAMQLQTLHTEQYLAQVEKLNGIINDPNQTRTAQTNAQTQLVELNARRSSQQMQDTAAVAQTTVGGALKQANQQWLQNTQNLAPQIVSIYTNVFQGMNQQITNLLSGQKTSWSSFFRSIAASFASVGLNALEAPFMSSIQGAFSKKQTSSTSSTTVDGLIPSAEAIASLAGNYNPLSLGVSLFGKIAGFRAAGGPVEAGKTYIVGEHGPEPVTFGSSGVMGTNRDFQAMHAGSYGTQHNYEIHVGNGVTPEQFHQTMQQLIPQIHRKAVSDAVRTVSERNRRMPSTAQR